SSILSCGRFGPAIDGTTVDRSRVSSSEKRSSRAGSCHRPWAFAYFSTRSSWVSERPVSRRYSIVASSIGKIAQVEPNSGDMLPIVARFATGTCPTPSPWNSTNLPTTPCLRSISVIVRTRSGAVAVRGCAGGQWQGEDLRDQHGDGLAEHGRLRLDAADAPAEDAEAVLHGGVAVGADAGVGIRLVAVLHHHPR